MLECAGRRSRKPCTFSNWATLFSGGTSASSSVGPLANVVAVFFACSASAATKASWMPDWASTRVAAVQSWPALK